MFNGFDVNLGCDPRPPHMVIRVARVEGGRAIRTGCSCRSAAKSAKACAAASGKRRPCRCPCHPHVTRVSDERRAIDCGRSAAGSD